MKLIACRIENFGKLSGFRMDFSDGVNILTEPNGWGKSTLAVFLKAMLYGFDTKKEEGAFEKERKMYLPWQGGRYGGTLDIEADGKKYRIERYFGTTEKGDSFHLYDLETNLESRDYTANIGVELFDIDRASFKKTIYIAQNNCESGSSDSINAKLGNLAQASDDINNYENALSSIRARLNQLSPRRATGSLMRRKNLITQLQQENMGLQVCEDAVDTIQSKMATRQEQCREIIAIRAEYSKALLTASEDSRKKELKGSYEDLCRQLQEKESSLADYTRYFPDGVPSDAEFRKCQDVFRELENQKLSASHLALDPEESAELLLLRQKFQEGIPAEDSITDMMNQAAEFSRGKRQLSDMEAEITHMERQAVKENGDSYVDPTPQKSVLPPVGGLLALFGIISLVIAAAIAVVRGVDLLFFIVLLTGILLAVGGALVFLLGKQMDSRNANDVAHRLEVRDRQMEERDKPIRKMREEMAGTEKKLQEQEKSLNGFLSPFLFVDSELPYREQLYMVRSQSRRLQELELRQGAYEEADQMQEKLSSRLKDYAAKMGLVYGPSMIAELADLQAKAAEYEMIEEEMGKLRLKKRQFEAENDLNEILNPQTCPYTLDQLHEMICEADQSIEELRSSIDQYARQLEDLQQQLDQKDEKEQDLAAAQEAQAQEAKEYEILELTSHYLEKAKEKFVVRYMGGITSAFDKYYTYLTGEHSDEWMIDANLCLKLRQQGEMRETRYLSAGYRDLLGICMRLSLIDAMYREEKPFLLFDDPFVNLDDEKMAKARNLVSSLGDDYQVIYFTCQENRNIPRNYR